MTDVGYQWARCAPQRDAEFGVSGRRREAGWGARLPAAGPVRAPPRRNPSTRDNAMDIIAIGEPLHENH